VEFGGGPVGELEAGIELELGVEPSPAADEVLGGGITGELEAGIELELVFCGELDPGAGFPEPDTQPGSRLAAVAGAGPLVTATQPGRCCMGPWTSSEGIGLGAVHEFISASETKRFSLANTGQFSITPEPSVQVCIARESTSLFHPSMKSPCSP
jgi:hypothetical protein